MTRRNEPCPVEGTRAIILFVSADLHADPRSTDYTSLKDVALRPKLGPERGLYMAESTNVIIRALQIGHSPRSFLMSERWLPQFAPLIREAIGDEDGGEVPISTANEDVLRQITGFHLHRGALATAQRLLLPTVSELLPRARGGEPARRVVILEGLVDHTGTGVAFRSTAAPGVDAVLVTPSCVDPLYRRSMHVSMRIVLQVPQTRLKKWPMADGLHETGFTLVTFALCDDSISLKDLVESSLCTALGVKVTLVIGTESDGLNRKTIAACDVIARIPISGDVNSLNVAAASAVAFWTARKVGAWFSQEGNVAAAKGKGPWPPPVDS